MEFIDSFSVLFCVRSCGVQTESTVRNKSQKRTLKLLIAGFFAGPFAMIILKLYILGVIVICITQLSLLFNFSYPRRTRERWVTDSRTSALKRREKMDQLKCTTFAWKWWTKSYIRISETAKMADWEMIFILKRSWNIMASCWRWSRAGDRYKQQLWYNVAAEHGNCSWHTAACVGPR